MLRTYVCVRMRAYACARERPHMKELQVQKIRHYYYYYY